MNNTKYCSRVVSSSNQAIASRESDFLSDSTCGESVLFESFRSHVFWRLAGTGCDRSKYRSILHSQCREPRHPDSYLTHAYEDYVTRLLVRAGQEGDER